MSDRAPHHFSPLHLGPAGDPRERAGEDQGRPLDPQALFNKKNKSTAPFSEVTLGRNGSDVQGCLAEAGKRFLITASRFYCCGGKMCSLETNGSFPSTASDMFICLRQKKKQPPNNCIAVNTAALSGRFDLYVVVPLCSNAAGCFSSPPLAQCRKLFLLPHYIILQHL